MASKPNTINPTLEKAIKNALFESQDFKERMMAINAAIKWEAVKMKMADNDFGSHFLDDKDEPSDNADD